MNSMLVLQRGPETALNHKFKFWTLKPVCGISPPQLSF